MRYNTTEKKNLFLNIKKKKEEAEDWAILKILNVPCSYSLNWRLVDGKITILLSLDAKNNSIRSFLKLFMHVVYDRYARTIVIYSY